MEILEKTAICCPGLVSLPNIYYEPYIYCKAKRIITDRYWNDSIMMITGENKLFSAGINLQYQKHTTYKCSIEDYNK